VEVEKLGVNTEGLGDMKVLVDGFLQLVRSSQDQQRTSQPPAADARPIAVLPGPAPGSRSAAKLPAPPPVSASRVYSAADELVSPPVALDQRLPSMTTEMQSVTRALRTTGVLDILIDENGRVVDVTIRKSLSASADALIVQSALRWKYRPAKNNGVPVRYLKTLVLVP
jgi:hypothetical protein